MKIRISTRDFSSFAIYIYIYIAHSSFKKVDNSEIEIRELQGSTLIPALNLNSIELDGTSNCTSYPFFSLFFFRTCHLPRCQIGALAGLLSTSHFRLTDIPSTIGIPKPGKRVIANDGVSETGIKQLVSIPQRQCARALRRASVLSHGSAKKGCTGITVTSRQIGLL